MKTRTLGNSGLHVSAIGYGCMGLTGSTVPPPTGGRPSRSFARQSSTA